MSGACQPAETIAITVRDPSAVTIEAQVLGNRAVEILPAGRAATEVTFPRSEPPYRGAVLFEASVLRREDGSISMRCDACLKAPALQVVDRNGVTLVAAKVAPPGTPAIPAEKYVVQPELPRLMWTNDQLRVGLTQPYWVSSGKSLLGPYPAFEYRMVIPREVLVDARFRREDLKSAGWGMLLVGVPLTALATALLVVGGKGLFNQPPGPKPSAWPVLAWGGGCLLGPLALVADAFAIGFLASAPPVDRSLVPTAWSSRGPSEGIVR